MSVETLTLHKNWPISAQIGRTWFKWRSFSPIPLFVMLFILPADFSCSAWQSFMLISGVLIAESLRLWAVGYAGSTTRTRGETVQQLVHAGPYRHVRNPLYIANILMYTLCGIVFGFGLLSFFIFIYSSIEYYFIVSFEEQILSKTFGPSYGNYVRSVPRWIPSFKPSFPTSGHEFSLLSALKSEKSTFYSMMAMLAAFLIKSYLLK